MSQTNDRVEQDRQLILDAKSKGKLPTWLAYVRLSGPGWLQSAITLGGGSLAGSLYLGSVGGYEMLWLQPLMMIFGVVMLSAIGYVALSSGERPFHLINRKINPVLGWSWIIATLMANLVWAMPQFSLGTGALQENLGILPDNETGKWLGVFILFVVAGVIIWFYDSGGWGIKLFELVLKLMVGVVVISFFAVVVAMTINKGLPWGDIFSGFIPNPGLLFEPADSLRSHIENSSAPEYWREVVLSGQRDRMVAAAATAVGINMTFLLPYSMLKRGWDKNFTGLATFDLSTGLFIPFVLATSCVMIAAASQFHAQADPALIGEAPRTEQSIKAEGAFKGNLDKVLQEIMEDNEFNILKEGQATHDTAVAAKKNELAATTSEEEINAMIKEDPNLGLGFGPLDQARNALKMEDKVLASTLVKRDAGALAGSLEELAGPTISQVVFGIGVVGMAISTIIILMLINGFTVCEMFNVPSRGAWHRIGCYLPAFTGALGFMYLWGSGEAKFYLAVPTSRFGMVLLPVAYIAFFFLMNSRKVLGDRLPTGSKRIFINILMLIALALAVTGAGVSIANEKAMVPNTNISVKHIAFGLIGLLVILAIAFQFIMPKSNDEKT